MKRRFFTFARTNRRTFLRRVLFGGVFSLLPFDATSLFSNSYQFASTKDSTQEVSEKNNEARGENLERFFFVSAENVCWRVDRSNGRVAALDPVSQTPIWSKDGTVYRIPGANETDPTPRFFVSTVVLFGRIYFLFNSATQAKSTFYNARQNNSDFIIALDPQAQGRLVWILKANDFAPLFSSNENAGSHCRWTRLPETVANDRLLLEIACGTATRRLFVDAASGQIVELATSPP